MSRNALIIQLYSTNSYTAIIQYSIIHYTALHCTTPHYITTISRNMFMPQSFNKQRNGRKKEEQDPIILVMLGVLSIALSLILMFASSSSLRHSGTKDESTPAWTSALRNIEFTFFEFKLKDEQQACSSLFVLGSVLMVLSFVLVGAYSIHKYFERLNKKDRAALLKTRVEVVLRVSDYVIGCFGFPSFLA